MEKDQLVDQLASFGLDDRSARVFYHLSRLGSATASEVSNASGVQRTEVYRVMDDLEDDGFVEKTLERPRKYVPRPVEEALEEKLEQQRRQVDELEEARDTLAEQWPRIEHEGEAEQERFSVHQGRSQIRGALERMIETAEDEVLVAAPPRGIARLDTMGIVDELQERAGQGVRLRVLTEVGTSPPDAIGALAGAGTVRHLDLPGYVQFVMVDTSEIALFVSLDPLVSTQGSGETVLWLNARDFLLAQQALFDTLWTTGLNHDVRVQAIEADEPAPQAEIVRGRWMRYDRAKEMLHRAQQEVLVALPGPDVERLVGSNLDRALERAAGRGVDVTVITPEAVDLADVDARTSPIEGVSMLVVDNQEAMIAMGTRADTGSMASDAEWAVWSTLPDLVDHVCSTFETHLEQARAAAAEPDQAS